MPETRNELWNIATGIRLPFSDTTQLGTTPCIRVIPEQGELGHTLVGITL
jgi:hypothetical protein